MTISEIIAKRLDLRQQQVGNTMELLEGGATIPFISRYRKEATGGLNEVQVAQINDLNTQLGELVHRREYILETIEAQGKLTDALRQRISECWDATVLEDIYLPFKPKRKTRAEAARHAARQSDEGRREICDGGGARRGSCLARGTRHHC